MTLASKIAANPGSAVRMTKRLLRASSNVELSISLDMAAGMQALALQTSAHETAVGALLFRRSTPT